MKTEDQTPNIEGMSEGTIEILPKKVIRVIHEELEGLYVDCDLSPQQINDLRAQIIETVERVAEGYSCPIHDKVSTMYLYDVIKYYEAPDFEALGRHDIASHLENLAEHLREVIGRRVR